MARLGGGFWRVWALGAGRFGVVRGGLHLHDTGMTGPFPRKGCRESRGGALASVGTSPPVDIRVVLRKIMATRLGAAEAKR